MAPNGKEKPNNEVKVPLWKRFFWGDGDFITKSSFAAILVVVFIYARDKHWTSIDLPSLVLIVLMILASRLATDASAMSEKWCYAAFLSLVCVGAYFWNRILDHDCTECLLGVPDVLEKYLLPSDHHGKEKHSSIIHLFADCRNTPQKCAKCFLSIAWYFQWARFIPESIKDNVAVDTFEHIDDLAYLSDAVQQDAPKDYCDAKEGSCPAVQDPKALSPSEFRNLDEWYETMRKDTAPKNALKDFLGALAADINSEHGRELFNTMAHDFLCYPISRMNGPKPSEYLKNLEDPRWTGEEEHEGDGPMDIEFDKLVAIMRGDMMHTLQPDVCAMIRIASQLSDDDTVLTHSMSASRVAPVANETALKGDEHVSFLFPGLYIPKVDEDKDPEGSNPVGLLVSVFKRLPIVDDNPRFETRQEYLAFFRWLLEHKIQDEFYFPPWLSGINGTEEIGELVANQFRHRGDRQRIFDVTSDETLATRAFYGAGVKTLSSIVLPGDPSYGYLVNPEYYATDSEREFFKNEAMPSEEDLLRMASVAWGKQVKNIKKLRGKVVQVDYSLASHWEYRDAFEQNGAILYLDAEKRIPMGIWACCRKRLILPNAGMAWEHAKFIYRGTEVVTAALMHVGEYHLGWAERFSVALKQTLPHSHGLRALMKPYTHGTGAVNWQAYQMLLLEDSILSRADGFTNHGRSHSWGTWVKHSNLAATVPDLLAAKKLPPKLSKDLVYFSQGRALWDMHYDYVDKFVTLVYGKGESEILKDDDLQRFWHHINSGGRRLCPCVCDMDSAIFFTQDKWPGFETTRTCEGLLDHADFEMDESNMVQRRDSWCKKTLPQERSKALYSWLEADCEAADSCTEVYYELEHLRPNMGLPELSRKSLVNLITRFIYEVTAGHEMAADNIPFIVDPYYGGVRRNKDYDLNEQPMVDASTWVFGTVISALTTIRSMPLLADWSDLLESWVDNENDWRKLSDADRQERKKAVNDLHFEYKKALILNANKFLKESLKRPQNQWSPFLNPAVQAGSIAV